MRNDIELKDLRDVLFYLYHCKIHDHSIEKIDECLMIIVDVLDRMSIR